MIKLNEIEEREKLICDSNKLRQINHKQDLDELLVGFLDTDKEIDIDSDIVHFLGKYNQFLKKRLFK